MKFHLASTQPINTSSVETLTRSQVWEGLKIKARDPVNFVPSIASCEVVREDGDGLTRIVTFKPGTGPPGKITEIVTYAEGVKVQQF